MDTLTHKAQEHAETHAQKTQKYTHTLSFFYSDCFALVMVEIEVIDQLLLKRTLKSWKDGYN